MVKVLKVILEESFWTICNISISSQTIILIDFDIEHFSFCN